MERYQARALRGLQEAIVSCGPQNSDAIIAASILMMEGAQDWQQWMIYLSGYSAVCSFLSIINLKLDILTTLGPSPEPPNQFVRNPLPKIHPPALPTDVVTHHAHSSATRYPLFQPGSRGYYSAVAR